MKDQAAIWKRINPKEIGSANHFSFISGQEVAVSMWVGEVGLGQLCECGIVLVSQIAL